MSATDKESKPEDLESPATRSTETQARARAHGERRIRAILDAAVDAIVTIDTNGTIDTFNAAAESMFGYRAAEVIGRNVSLLMASPYRERHEGYLQRYARTHEPRVIGRLRQFNGQRKDGTAFPIQLSVSEIRELGLFIGVVRDLTGQRELEEEIVRIATLEQRRIGEELHDTTLQELAGLGLLAQNLADALKAPETARHAALASKLAAGIAKANQHVRALTRGLVPVPVDAEGLMAALANLAEQTQDEHAISCRFVCPEPVEIADDRIALNLYRIAQEAVTNAVKHARATTISIRLEFSAGGVRIEVRDDGIGIELDENHSGLGLRIMEHRCSLVGGIFSAGKHETAGTVVSCTIPVVKAS